MGHSVTCAIVGVTKANYLVTAMSRLEAHQEAECARRRGDPVTGWYAQTATGRRVLGGVGSCDAADLPSVARMICPKCGGKGCGICRGSGFATQQHFAGYQAWQLEPERGA